MSELRQDARKEYRHLGIAEIADEALPESREGGEPATFGLDAAATMAVMPPGAPQHMHAQIGEIGSAGELDSLEDRFGSKENGHKPGGRRQRPDDLPERHAGRGEEAAFASAQHHTANRHGRVRSGRHDDEDSDT